MRKMFSVLLLLALSSTSMLAIQEAADSETEEEPLTEAERIQRAQEQAQAEYDAWQVLTAVTVPEEMLRLSQDFLAQFPDSELTPYIYKRMGLAYQELNDYENLVLYFEKTLEGLPNDPDARPFLAVAFAERGENNKAIDYGQTALTVLDTMEKPEDMDIGTWTRQKARAVADAQYGLGLAFLKRASNNEAILKRSVEHLEQATKTDPTFHRAYFRLGTAYTRLNEGEEAIVSFGRTAATDGVAQQLAREQLQRIYEVLKKDPNEIEPMILEQRQFVDSRVAEQEAMIQQLELEEQQRIQQLLLQQEQELQGVPENP